MAKFTILAALALGFGCDDKDDSVGEGDSHTDADSDTDTDTDAIPDKIDVQWGSDSVSVDITGGAGTYEFGIFEGDSAEEWTAEDCIGGTFTTKGGDVYGPFCHSVTADSLTTIDCVDTADDVTNATTLFCVVP